MKIKKSIVAQVYVNLNSVTLNGCSEICYAVVAEAVWSGLEDVSRTLPLKRHSH